MLSCCAREQYLLVSGPTPQVVYMCLQNTAASPSKSYPKHLWGRNATQDAYPKHLWRLNATQERVAHTVPLRLQRPSPWHRLVPGRQWPRPVPHLPFCHGRQPRPTHLCFAAHLRVPAATNMWVYSMIAPMYEPLLVNTRPFRFARYLLALSASRALRCATSATLLSICARAERAKINGGEKVS